MTAWYVSYPPDVFPSLWEKIAESKDRIILIKSIYDEIEPFSSSDKKISNSKKKEKYPLRIWLEENGFIETKVKEKVNFFSLELEKKYEINDLSRGAGQKDITLIAYAKTTGATVVTFEAEQQQRPSKKCNYKIPLICKDENVKCINFITMLKNLGIKI